MIYVGSLQTALMGSHNDADGTTGLAPDAAFALLGNETRIRIVQSRSGDEAPISLTE